MKKNTAGLVVILAILAIAFFLNPGYSKHMSKLGLSSLENEIRTDKYNMGTASRQVIEYHDYFLFSTTTNSFTDQRMTFGVLGVVFR
jgi:hypothetical protein